MTTDTTRPALLLVRNPADFMTYCGLCGQSFRKGSYVQRIAGGYGWACEFCAPAAPCEER